jgi:flagellar protein FliO/FliZ
VNFRIAAGFLIAALPPAAAAAGESPLSAAMLAKVVIGLALVLAAFAAAAFLLRRAGGHGMSRTGSLRIVDAMAVGARERLVLVEVDGERVLLGMGPTQMCALHHFGHGTAARASATTAGIATPEPPA